MGAGETIETSRLRLEPWSEAHTAILVELSADPDVVRHIGLGEPWPAERARDVAEAQRKHWEDHGFGWRADVEKSSGEVVGLTALNLLGDGAAGVDPSEHEVGWWLKPSAWGRGLAVEGARAILAEAFGRLGAPSVLARIQPANEPSLAVAAVLGMRWERATVGREGERIEVFRLGAGRHTQYV